jgi:hypothetical protein
MLIPYPGCYISLLHFCYTFSPSSKCNTRADEFFATKPSNTFWKASEKVLESLKNNQQKTLLFEVKY